MTKEEAASILNVSLEADLEEIEEQFEQLLFERKKFFLQKLPIQKLFEPKLKAITQVIEAYELISGEKLENTTQLKTFEFQFDASSLLISFNHYHLYRNQLKQGLINASGFNDIEQIATELIKLESAYAALWYQEELNTQQIIVGTFPDEIQLLNALKNYLKMGGKSFDDLKKMKNNPPEILIQEMKRLSLLYKNYRWTKS
jgi:hypothetical protein